MNMKEAVNDRTVKFNVSLHKQKILCRIQEWALDQTLPMCYTEYGMRMCKTF